MSDALQGRVALVTGAGRGIGRAIAERLAADGCAIVVADNGTGMDGQGADPTVAREVAKVLPRAVAFTESIASPGAAQAAVALAVKQFGGVDIVVNNAAILRDTFVFKTDALDYEAVIRTNLMAPAWITQAATAAMRDQVKTARGGGTYGWGRIINLVSTAGLYGNFGQAAYASAKSGLIGLTRVTAMDMARSNVTANAIAPFAATRVTDSIRPANEAQATYKERALKVPASGVANLVAWLSGDAAADVTGQVFGVRGREVLLFSQARPAARVLADGTGAFDAAPLRAAFTDLRTDLEHFSYEPEV